MEQMEFNIQKRKKAIGRISITFIIVIVLLTFFSKTINNFLLPKVTVTNAVRGRLQWKFNGTGYIEIQNASKIYANGNWKIKEVLVKNNQSVAKGTVLAVVDQDEVMIELKNMQIELTKLENSLKKYRSDFEKVTLPSLKRDIELAGRDLSNYEENLKSIKALYDAGAESQKNLEKAETEYQDIKYSYEQKQNILEERKRDFEASIKEKTLELEMKKLQYEKMSTSLPQDGKIISNLSGRVVSINIEEGMIAFSNEVLFEIEGDESEYRICWNMSMEKAKMAAIGDDVTVSFYAKKLIVDEGEEPYQKVEFQTSIREMEYVPDLKLYECRADLKIKDVNIEDGQYVEISHIKSSKVYESLVALSGLVQVQGKDSVFVVRKRTGVFGEEMYVEAIDVKVDDVDDFNCAVKESFRRDEQIVVETTKPLTDGMQVKLR